MSTVPTPSCSQPLYAVIDLGSNSFHMLIARLVADSVQVVDKVKRKVRLASGLDDDNQLDAKSMARGWECLSFFAERLQDIPKQNIKVVATATLRLAKNRQQFLDKAEQVLGHSIEVISGVQEAENIYLGVAHTTCSADKRLVIDIGGASTELVVGSGFDSKLACSLDMGCVTFNNAFFAQGALTESAFTAAISQARTILSTQKAVYKQQGWDVALGVSGTLQAVAEILTGQGLVQRLTLANLQAIKQQVIGCEHIDRLDIVGLQTERKPVFAPGLAILIAIFLEFDVSEVHIAGGAIREGILYELLPNMRNVNIRQRTLAGLIQRFSIDERHAYRVANIADNAFSQVQKVWSLSPALASILQSACALHEIGLLLEYKASKKHAQYIIEHADLAGFSNAERMLLIALIGNHKTELNLALLDKQSYTDKQTAIYLIVILRLAVILSKRRKDDVMPSFGIQGEKAGATLSLPESFMKSHPLISAELKQEVLDISECQFSLQVITNR
ncbi:guanosine-5'-triphosphate,3'-diphosphate pyrophosphatase [Thalassotalea sp. Y01]|uniref:Ppx/GppA phosphatase family protein n=1 Tax=Thalassotalea sp. Y01 TaxID=2729613 RepID=UPI0032B86B36